MKGAGARAQGTGDIREVRRVSACPGGRPSILCLGPEAEPESSPQAAASTSRGSESHPEVGSPCRGSGRKLGRPLWAGLLESRVCPKRGRAPRPALCLSYLLSPFCACLRCSVSITASQCPLAEPPEGATDPCKGGGTPVQLVSPRPQSPPQLPPCCVAKVLGTCPPAPSTGNHSLSFMWHSQSSLPPRHSQKV